MYIGKDSPRGTDTMLESFSFISLSPAHVHVYQSARVGASPPAPRRVRRDFAQKES